MSQILTISKVISPKQRVDAPRVYSHTTTKVYPGRKPQVQRKLRLGSFISSHAVLKAMSLVLVVGNLVLLGLHVVQANSYAVKGYEITELRNNIANLQEENKKLSLRLSENTSIVGVQQILSEKRFVPVTVTEYIKSNPSVSIK